MTAPAMTVIGGEIGHTETRVYVGSADQQFAQQAHEALARAAGIVGRLQGMNPEMHRLAMAQGCIITAAGHIRAAIPHPAKEAAE